jgi:hypothetical protein
VGRIYLYITFFYQTENNFSFCDSGIVLIGIGFWDEVAPTAPKPTGKSVGGKAKAGPATASTGNNPSGKASGSKTRSKKEEALVLKLFEQNVPRGDEFTQWCSKALSGLQSSVDSEYPLKSYAVILANLLEL